MSTNAFASSIVYTENGMDPHYKNSLQRARSDGFGSKVANGTSGSKAAPALYERLDYASVSRRAAYSETAPPVSFTEQHKGFNPDASLEKLKGFGELGMHSRSQRKSPVNFTSASDSSTTASSVLPREDGFLFKKSTSSKVLGVMESSHRPTTADPFYSSDESNTLRRSQSTYVSDRPKSSIGTRPDVGVLDRSKSSLGLLEQTSDFQRSTSPVLSTTDDELSSAVENLHIQSTNENPNAGLYNAGQAQGQQNNMYEQQPQFMHGFGLSPVINAVPTHYIPGSPGLYPQPVAVPQSPVLMPLAPHPVSPYHGGMASPYIAASPSQYDYLAMMSQPHVLNPVPEAMQMQQQLYTGTGQDTMGIPASPFHMPTSFLAGYQQQPGQPMMHHNYPATPGHRVHTGYSEAQQMAYAQDPYYGATAAVVHQAVEFSPAPFYSPHMQQHPGASVLPAMSMPPAANQSGSPRYLKASIHSQYSHSGSPKGSREGLGAGTPETALQRAHRMGGNVQSYPEQQERSSFQQGRPFDEHAQESNQSNSNMRKTTMLDELRTKMKQMPQNNGNRRNSASNNSLQSNPSAMGINWGLTDIKGMVCDFAKDQYGSRFIQQKLEDHTVSGLEKQQLFEEVLPHAKALCKDVFGNYVVQKLLDPKVGNSEQQVLLCDSAIVGNVVDLSRHMYGCRVIQKLVEQVFGSRGMQGVGKMYDMAYQDSILIELQDMVMDCVRDQNGNHVIQKCIEQVRPISRIGFMLDSFRGNFTSMARHPYGCRVVQRVLENCDPARVEDALDELIRDATELTSDQYANYVIQHIIVHQAPGRHRQELFAVVTNNVLAFSQHKFGSNVVEACLQSGQSGERAKLIDGMLKGPSPPLQAMMKDPYANYVVQKVIDKSTEAQREKVCQIVKDNESSLKRLTFGKHIINKIKS